MPSAFQNSALFFIGHHVNDTVNSIVLKVVKPVVSQKKIKKRRVRASKNKKSPVDPRKKEKRNKKQENKIKNKKII